MRTSQSQGVAKNSSSPILNNKALSVLMYKKGNEEFPISFELKNGALMANATEMAKPFKKDCKDFFRTQQTKDYIQALSQVANMPLEKISIVNHGGEDKGTWMCDSLALRFAQWLSVDFSIWVDANIKELLTHGSTSLSPVDGPAINDACVEILEYEYNNMLIRFRMYNAGVMVDVLSVFSAFGLSGEVFLTDETKARINLIARAEREPLNNVYQYFQYGKHESEWIHELLALQLADRIDFNFCVWLNKKFKHLQERMRLRDSCISEAKVLQDKPKDKGSYLGMEFLGFDIKQYTKTIEAVPNKILEPDYLWAIKRTVDGMVKFFC